jgi:hypothetical protein
MAKEIFDINGLQGGFSFNHDLSPYDMPPNMFNDVQNVRFSDKKAGRIEGHTQVLGTPSADPYWAISWTKGSTDLWIYGGVTELYQINDTTHSTVTRTSGAYTTLSGTENNWQGGILGGVLVCTNGLDVPQKYAQGDSRFSDLTNWPSTLRCKSIVPFKNHLIALNLTDSGTELPFSIRWSDAIPEGASSNGANTWVTSSTDSEAAQTTIGGTKGHVLNALSLGNELMVYKEDSVYAMTYVGGAFTFQIRERFKNAGLIAQNAVTALGDGRHVFVGPDDIYIHNGTQLRSIVDDQVRTFFFNDLEQDSAYRTFCAHNKIKNEVWICYAASDATDDLPNKALIWNYVDNSWATRDLPGTRYIAQGIVNPTYTNSWTNTATTWQDTPSTWGFNPYSSTRDSLIICGTADTKLYLVDYGNDFDGTDFTCVLERVGLHAGRTDMVKSVTRMYPRIQGTGTVRISVGGEINPYEGVTYSDPVTFRIGQDSKVDCRVRGRYIAVKFETTDDTQFNLSGYTLEAEVVSDR